MKITHIKKDNFNVNVLQTTKFKTTRIEISFSNHLTEENATKRALIPYLLKAVSKSYPTRSKLQIHLEDMYSAGFGAAVKKVGLTQMITFDLSIINNKYTLNNEDLFKEGISFLKEIIFNPLFTEDIFLEEKRLLDEYFKGIYANKMRYAVRKALANMYEGETFNIDAFGREEDLSELTLTECITAYNNMISKDTININIVGDVDIDNVNIIINEELRFEDRVNNLVLVDQLDKPQRDAKQLFESQNVNQGKLVIGYHFPIYYNTEDYYKGVVLGTLVGSGAESLLFKKIREEMSLVYFIGAAYDQNKGSFIVYSGINQTHFDEVIKEVDKTLTDVLNQNYDDKFLTIAKKGIVSGLLQSFDNGGSLISRLNSLSLFNKELNLEELVSKINSVTKDDLSTLIPLLKKDITYLLRNDDIENN